MIVDASDFVFMPPPELNWSRRVLIKPYAGCSLPYPATTSPQILQAIISGIRKVSDADIIIAAATPSGEPIYSTYKALEYNFHHVLMLDIRDSIFVEVENPLVKFYAVESFWIPNIVLRSDFLISVAPFRVCGNLGLFGIANLLDLLPVSKYQKGNSGGWGSLYDMGIEKVLADLYFTMPFDLSIIEAQQRVFYSTEGEKKKVEDSGKIFIGDLYDTDLRASQMAGIESEYLRLIDEGRSQLEE
jgi:uncharacterized protein (DUF362 family)